MLTYATHVAAAAGWGYAIDTAHRALGWNAQSGQPAVLLDDVAWLAAGESSLMAIRLDGSLWQHRVGASGWAWVAPAALHAWVGDSSDYYIDARGTLYASGQAHRGQYGNGQLDTAPGWVAVAEGAVAVAAHTGHAVYLRDDGALLGTGGNRFGPLGAHGYGDMAERWGVIFGGVSQMATGSRHTVAIRPDGSLWGWGADDGLQPRLLMTNVAAVAAGDTETIALTHDDQLWQWRVGQTPFAIEL
jgi:hypothetical protein